VGDGRPRAAGAAGPVRSAAARHAAIFDLDGVRVDSEPYHHAAWRRLYNISVVPTQFGMNASGIARASWWVADHPVQCPGIT
jgi:hypothetical protein